VNLQHAAAQTPVARSPSEAGSGVVLVNGSRTFDGHARHFEMYWRALESRGVHPSVVTCVDPSLRREYPDWGSIVEGWKVPGGGSLEMGLNRLFPVFTRQLQRLPGRVLHVNDVYLASAARFRSDVAVTVADLAKAYTSIYPWASSWVHNRNLPCVRKARVLVCHSDFVRGEILARLAVPEERVHIVPLFSLLDPLRGAPRPRPPPPSEGSPWNLLYVATDRPHKNIRLFLDVLARLGPRFRGTLVSRLRAQTVRRIGELGLMPRLTVIDRVPRLEEVYGSAQVLLYPSLYEGFGIPLVEALSQGLPVVASDRTAIPGVVGNGGQILPESDPAPWCEAVERLTDPHEYDTWSARAIDRGREFTMDRTASALLAAYAPLLEGG
jgi:O-antigen biosynthesis alpha-1,3-rhamnosyltransferase